MLQSLIAFLGAAVLIAMAPGPSTVVIMRESVRGGRRAGAATILGNETGVVLWGLAAAFGLSALLAASQVAYDVLRVAGAAVLVYFGVRAVWQARRGRPAAADAGPGPGGGRTAGRRPAAPAGPAQDDQDGQAARDGRDGGRAGGGLRSFRLGLITNFANPKAGVFAVSFLPQFVPEGAPVLATLALFSLLWALVDAVWYLGIVWVIGVARRFFERPVVRRRLEQVSGVVLVGLGIRLAAEAR